MNDAAVSSYLVAIDKANEHVKVIQQYLDDHGEILPDDVNWAHVTEMNYLAEVLKIAVDRIKK
jgi:hypothetical protein